MSDDDDKFVSPVDLPTPYQCELLTILMEECAEVIQRASKIIRFGITEIQPGQSLNNMERFSAEIGDLACMMQICLDDGLIDEDESNHAAQRKIKKLVKYMQTKRDDDSEYPDWK